ncbi:MAG: HD domain-containing protein [Gammaproteobacteria bacterium]|nr:HD domain-containing protein [Gammaproteobacteria bacterium]
MNGAAGFFDHEDKFTALDQNIALTKKLEFVHEAIRERFAFVDRIAVALYDPKTDLLKTFLHSSGGDRPLSHYQARLSETESLGEILERGRPRVVNDLRWFGLGDQEHTQRIARQGYRASYTMPMYSRGQFFGFLFFNSYTAEAFSEEVLRQLDPLGHLISLTILQELSSMYTLLATVRTARDIAHVRDSETGSHLDRMSRYARLIAKNLAGKHGLSDKFIEDIFVFSPLHDIGKIGIPDDVLLKPASLTPPERELMKTHTLRGRELIDRMLGNFELAGMPNIDMLRNIAEYHHEALDGSGYPHGMRHDEIPLEARIVAVADIFDALTSRRPYKRAWTNDEAFDMLRNLSGLKLDPDCVEALARSRAEVEEIQCRFGEDSFG